MPLLAFLQNKIPSNKNKSLKILIANIYLSSYTGTELVVRDLAIGFKNLGHQPMVYAPKIGGISSQILAAGIPVVSDLALLPFKPDVIHGHHHIETLQCILAFPGVPALFVCHSGYDSYSTPLKMDFISTFVAVDFFSYERLSIYYLIPKDKINIIFNWVDTKRFTKVRTLPVIPKKALVFSNYVENDATLKVIKEACKSCHLSLDVIGFTMGQGVANPEEVLSHYDIIFAKGKCALEALTSGAAVIVGDKFGLSEMVSTQNVLEFRNWNFGIRLFNKALTVENLITEIKKYNSDDSAKVTDLIRSQVSLDQALTTYLNLYQKIIKEAQIKPTITLESALSKYAQDQLERISFFEKIHQQPFKMQPITKEVCQKIFLKLIHSPERVSISEDFHVNMNLKNDSHVKLGTFYPYLIHFSYWWKNIKDNHLIEGLRTTLKDWVNQGAELTQEVLIHSPEAPGQYLLMVTLVQEDICWLHEHAPSSAVEIPITVV